MERDTGSDLFLSRQLLEEYRLRSLALADLFQELRTGKDIEVIKTEIQIKLDDASLQAEVMGPTSPTAVLLRKLYLIERIKEVRDREKFGQEIFH